MNLFSVLYSTHDIHMLCNIKMLGHIGLRPQFILFCLLLGCAVTHSALDVQVSAKPCQSWFTFGFAETAWRPFNILYSHEASYKMQYNNLEQSGDPASITNRNSSVTWMLNVTSVQQVNSSQHISPTRDSITQWKCGHFTIYDTQSSTYPSLCMSH
jgi:hypothetical protein